MNLLSSGEFTLGCNYWASHAGTSMWRDWQANVVKADFQDFQQHGLQVLRVFPLWPDFQPIRQLNGVFGTPVEIRFGPHEAPLAAGRLDGLDPVMLGRFRELCDLAQTHGLKLIVGLVTGWMSGRLFVPPALEGRNVITDHLALAWQARFVRGFVQELKDHPAIYAWDLGNECNCMGRADTPDHAYTWTATIAHAIKANDSSRPVVSGMHSLSPGSGDNPWRITHQAELTDILTTHPYPYWLVHGRTDPLDAPRTTLLPTIETCLYGDIGRKVCIAEEIGSMGPMVAADEVAASWARANLLSLWAHDARAYLWWCGYDQGHLRHAPYDWIGVEVELGLMRSDRSPKPVLQEMSAFASWLKTLPFPQLSPRKREAVCLLSRGQNSWAAAIGTFTLAKQAGFDVRFAFVDQELPPAALYLVPAVSGLTSLHGHEWRRLVERVPAGASLYVSLSTGVLPEFEAITGTRVVRRCDQGTRSRQLTFPDGSHPPLSIIDSEFLELESTGARIHATDTTGRPLLTQHALGKGQVFVLGFPLETQLALASDGLHPANSATAAQVYRCVAQGSGVRAGRVVQATLPSLAVTEHPQTDGTTIVIALNLTRDPVVSPFTLNSGQRLKAVLRGAAPADGLLHVRAHDAFVAVVGSS